MRNLDFYLDEAITRAGISSERKLCAMLRVSPNAITGYRKKGILPSDETMVKLAKIAHLPPEQALLDLNIWRSAGTSKALYTKIAEMLKHTSMAAFVLLASSAPALIAQVSSEMSASIYYGKRKRNFLSV